LDFALILRLRNSPSIEALETGACSARLLFPTTGSFVRDRSWVSFDESKAALTVESARNDEAATAEIEQFLNQPLDPSCSTPVQQLLIVDENQHTRKVVTRFHHVAADGLSAALWLRHQLRVAYGLEDCERYSAGHHAPVLKEHGARVKKSIFAFPGRSERLWCRNGNPSRRRSWRTLHIDAGSLRRLCRRAGGFTYNDLLATCLLEILVRWNAQHGSKNPRNVSLWFPVNVRVNPTLGFGNGSSRIRIYSCYDESSSLIDKCRSVRRQVSWSIKHGEWAVPSTPALDRLPHWAIKPMLRGYLSRPSVDMGTSVFSHVERLTAIDDSVFTNIEEIECVGLLHKSHCLAVNGATLRGATSLTFTYDPSLLTQADIERLIEFYEEQIELALTELR
jgi:hypothetical protein